MSSVNSTKLSQQETMALNIGKRTKSAEDNLMTAYSIKEGDTDGLKRLADTLGLSAAQAKDATPRSLQLIAEQRFQNASQVFSLFSTLMDKIDQMKQRVISKLSN